MKSGTIRRGRNSAFRVGVFGKRSASFGAALGIFVAVNLGQAQQVEAYDAQAGEWHLAAMHADELWKTSTGRGIKVAVVDTGVNPDTPSLKGQVLKDEVPASASYGALKDYLGHGTSMAEIIAGTGGGGGIKGLAPDAKIIPIRVKLDELKDPEQRKKTADRTAAIRAAADSGAQIINMSFGGPGGDKALLDAVDYAVHKGKLLIAGVGNDREKDNAIIFPGAIENVLGVSAANQEGKVASFSESGNYVDLAAPGENEPAWCDNTFKSYCDSGGTSQASAIASASAALIWSAHPEWTANQVIRVMLDTAGRDWPKDEPSKYLGYGLVRPAPNLLDGKGDPGPADISPLTGNKTTGSATGEPGTSKSPAASQAPGDEKGGKGQDSGGVASGGDTSEAAGSESSGGGSQTWLIVGIVAAVVVVIGGGAFAFARRGRTG